jgi:hypothetical protein
MLTMLGSRRRCCDGITRRETLRAGALTALGGLSLANVLEAQASPTFDERAVKAKNVLVLFLLGGAATQDMWDLKPDAPAEVRGEFKPIDTSAPGVKICELLPETSKWMHRGALVRSVNHKAGCHNTIPCYTGDETPLPDNTTTKDTNPPSMGSILRYLDEQERHRKGLPPVGSDELPGYVYLPCYLGWGQNIRRPGPYAGFLGRRYDALYTECSPFGDESEPAPIPGVPRVVRGVPAVANATLPEEITLDRLGGRRGLLQQMDDEMRRIDGLFNVRQHHKMKEQAYGMLASAKTRAAFDLSQEKPETVERYGKTLFGNSALIGRRLIESGVRFVNVTWDLFWDRVKVDYDAWDTHTKNFEILRKNKLPHFDQTLSALLSDLNERGLLDETLVLITSEMGRTPRINGNAGRDHWTNCYSSVFFGGGIAGGTVYGESDATAAFVKDKPVSTSDICCTVYQQLGITPETTVPERNGRPVPITHGGKPIWGIL